MVFDSFGTYSLLQRKATHVAYNAIRASDDNVFGFSICDVVTAHLEEPFTSCAILILAYVPRRGLVFLDNRKAPLQVHMFIRSSDVFRVPVLCVKYSISRNIH